MYIAPNSTIKLLTGVPIDKNQSDTLWFASVGEQTAYFNGKAKRTFSLQTYQRTERGYCRLEVNPYDIYDCNYMMFQNTSYGSKWFYAFIDSIEYINNEVAELRFTLDPIQSWFFDYTLNQCYIERCTPTTDNIGDNILPEPVQPSEFVTNGDYTVVGLDTRDMGIVVVINDPQHSASLYGGGIYNGVMSGGRLYAFDATLEGIQLINDIVLNSDTVLKAPDAVLMIYMCPKILFPSDENFNILSQTLSDHAIGQGTTALGNVYPLTAISKNTQLDGYTPRNAKCYTYPYTYFHVDNGQGEGIALRYEFFDNLTPKVSVHGNSTYPVEITLFPYQYKNSPQAVSPDFGEYRKEKLAIKGFPQCSWSMDAWAAWLAQNSVPMIIDAAAIGIPMLIGGAVGLAGGLATGGLAGTVTGVGGSLGMIGSGMNGAMSGMASQAGGLFGTIASYAKQGYSASISADITKGSFQTGSNDVASERMVFKGGCVTQPASVMRTIDAFFDAFGYAHNKWDFVNIHARTRWTYVKTVGANVEGGLPSDDAQYIANCYDSGIRFWADKTNPCDYRTANGFLS